MAKIISQQASLITKGNKGDTNCLKWIIKNDSKLPWPAKPLIKINSFEPEELDLILEP
jgi:hypothetical protein